MCNKVVFFEIGDSSFILLLVPFTPILTKEQSQMGGPKQQRLDITTAILISGVSGGRSSKVAIYSRTVAEKTGEFETFQKLIAKDMLKKLSLIRLFYQQKRLVFNTDDARSVGEGLIQAYDEGGIFGRRMPGEVRLAHINIEQRPS